MMETGREVGNFQIFKQGLATYSKIVGVLTVLIYDSGFTLKVM